MVVRVSPPQAGVVKTPTPLPWVLWLASATCSAQTLVIGLYDYSDLSAKEIVRLTDTASGTFAQSGIRIVWRQCRGTLAALSGTTCGGEMHTNEITMRLLPGRPRGSRDGTMGQTFVTPEGGYYASVFVRSVRAQASGFRVAFDILLGYAVAHEVGHCLLGPGHSYTGLMRGTWKREDEAEISRLSLHLTKQEARKAVARLTTAEAAAYK